MIIQAISYGEINTARLPKEYQEVEYIQSSGTQYIDTEIKPTANTKVLARVNVLSVPTRNAWVFGSRNSDASSRYEVIWIDGSSAYRFYYGTSNYTFSGVSSTGKLTITTAASGAAINGVSVTPTAATISSENSMYIFSCHGGTASNETSYMQLFSFQMYEGDILVRDFVPCYRKADGVVGLYDLVSGAFYTNSGTGAFTKGADVSDGGSSGEPFAFTYSGDFTDERVDGTGDVTLNTSGQLVTSGKTVRVTVYILAGGGGGAYTSGWSARSASGGGGGYQTVEVELAPGTYDIVIGSGGAGKFLTNAASTANGGTGGDTIAFGYTSTGGTGGRARGESGATAGKGGTPNGNAGAVGSNTAGGSPNGGASNGKTATANSGGPGLVRITFS